MQYCMLYNVDKNKDDFFGYVKACNKYFIIKSRTVSLCCK